MMNIPRFLSQASKRHGGCVGIMSMTGNAGIISRASIFGIATLVGCSSTPDPVLIGFRPLHARAGQTITIEGRFLLARPQVDYSRGNFTATREVRVYLRSLDEGQDVFLGSLAPLDEGLGVVGRVPDIEPGKYWVVVLDPNDREVSSERLSPPQAFEVDSSGGETLDAGSSEQDAPSMDGERADADALDGGIGTFDGAPLDASLSAPRYGDEDEDGAFLCNEQSAFADDFDDNTLGLAWWPWPEGNYPTETFGNLVANLGPEDNASSGLTAAQPFPTENEGIWVEVLEMSGPTAAFFLAAESPGEGTSKDRVSAEEDHNGIFLASIIGGTQTAYVELAPHEPGPHFIRLRMARNETKLDTSPDGITWIERGGLPFAPTVARLDFGAFTTSGGANATVRFDNLNVGMGVDASNRSPRNGGWVSCPIQTFTDDFDDGMISYFWTSWPNGTRLVEETGGRLRIDVAEEAPGNAYATLLTRHAYELTGQRLFFEVTHVPAAETSNFGMSLTTVTGEEVADVEVVGQSFKVDVGGRTIEAPYDSVTDRFWSLREADGLLYFETSTDSTHWMQRSSHTLTMPVIDVVPDFWAGSWAPVAAGEYGEIDNFNVTP